jgi:hydrogenase nickel incorporation protein HypB
MCATCGCGDDAGVRVNGSPAHGHGHGVTTAVSLEQKVLARNDELAASNRSWLTARGIVAINLMSSPGSGKTTLLERTIRALGDQETSFDADRIRATGAAVVQVNTGAGCHLDSAMLARAFDTLAPREHSVVFIENVGNLVCPALFDLGEHSRAVVVSVTEGADKPLKYPHMFRTADVVLLNKMDLLPYVEFDIVRFRQSVIQLSPSARVFEVSATRGDGIPEWYGWLQEVAGLQQEKV